MSKPLPTASPWRIPQLDRFKWLLVFALNTGLWGCQKAPEKQPDAARAVAKAFYQAHHHELPTPWMRRGQSFIVYPTRSIEEDDKKWLIYNVIFSADKLVGTAEAANFEGSFSDHPRFQARAREYATISYGPGNNGGPRTQALMKIFHVPQDQAWSTILHVSDSAIADYQRLAKSMAPMGATFGGIGKYEHSIFGFRFQNPKMMVINCSEDSLFSRAQKKYYQHGIMHDLAPGWYYYEDTTAVRQDD